MRRAFGLLLFLIACGSSRPPPARHNALIAEPGEPCFAPPRPWDDPPAGLVKNSAHLPLCPDDRFQRRGWFVLLDAGLE